MAEAVQPKAVFASCRLAFVPSRTFFPKTIAELSRAVEKYGGVSLEPERDGRLPLTKATHVVANSIDFEEYNQALELMLPVVTATWITHSLSRGKLAQIRPFSPDPRMIFSSINVTCGDIPLGDKEAISGATLALGGMESKDLTRLTTHVCALTMEHPKCREVVARKLDCKIVLPHWFDDCFKLGKKIDETPYLLPDPPIMRDPSRSCRSNADYAANRAAERVPIPEDSDYLAGAVAPFPDAIPNFDGPGWRNNVTVFQNRSVMLSRDLGIGRRFEAVVAGLIRRGGGKVIADVDTARGDDGEVVDVDEEALKRVDACDIFICQFRDGAQYVRAAQAKKHIGNLAWLFHIITNNEWCSPLRRLLHYPVPRHGIPGFEDFVITLSNYGGEARVYLENLVVAAGAKFTKTMRMDNTHLITARDSSEKCDAARDWNIHMVNHLWIEESYACCEVQSVTNTRYTTFPARTNLGEVIGQTFLDEERLEELFYPPGASGAEASNGTTADGDLGHADVDAGDDDDDETASEAEVETDKKAGERASEEKATRTQGRSRRPLDEARTPDRRAVSNMSTPVRQIARGTWQRAPQTGGRDKENDNGTEAGVVSSAGRSAKDKALTRLHGLAPDIALYEKEKKRKARDGHAPWGGKRAADLMEKALLAQRASRKRGSSEADHDDGGHDSNDSADGSEQVERPPKKHRPSLPPVKMRVVLTGYQRWVNSSAKEDAERRKLRSLGILIVQDNQPCDYLAAPCLVRTMKFLKTLARGPEVIDVRFISDVLDKGRWLDPADYALHDEEGEARFHVTLSTALSRARAHRGRLLWNVVVYCMADIKNGCDNYQAIAEANGAIFKTYRAHSGKTIKPTAPAEDGDAPPEPVYLLTSAAPAERALWPRFEQMAEEGNMEPRVVAPDWLLDVAMRQEVSFDEHYLARNFWK